MYVVLIIDFLTGPPAYIHVHTPLFRNQKGLFIKYCAFLVFYKSQIVMFALVTQTCGRMASKVGQY